MALLLGCAVPTLCLAANPTPTLLSIAPDGLFEDWTAARTNPKNITVDGDGASVPCPETPDRDCIVPSNSGDLDFLVWTYDQTSLYLLIKRFAAPTGNDSFWLHVDLDRDGYVSLGEPLARLRFQNSSSSTGVLEA